MSKLFDRLRVMARNESNVLGLTALLVGVLAGLGAVVLQLLLSWFTQIFLGSEGVATRDILRIASAPAVGGLLVGPLVARFAKEAKGHGVPEVMEAVALRGGRIRGRVAVAKTLASAITIGSGGSAGREGPIVQVGSTLGSKLGQLLKMSEPRVRVLVGCGAAGGIAAAFNAPLAGMFFALEVILQRFSARGIAAVALSAVTASVVWRTAFGNDPVLEVPFFGLRSPIELLFYLALGILAALVAVAFVKTLYWFEDRFEEIRFPEMFRPALGGLMMGSVGLALLGLIGEPLVYGNGIRGINFALDARIALWAMIVLIAAKMIATGLSLGSGGSGGVFAPSLFMGAMLGGAVGVVVNNWLPSATAEPGAYAMVGMAAVFSGAAQAPISAILILFEMTNDYRIILPLMLACVVSTVTYSLIQKESIYTAKLARRGVEIVEGRERHLTERISVSQALVTEYPTVIVDASAEEALRVARAAGTPAVIVVDERDHLVGTVEVVRLVEALEAEGPDFQHLIETNLLTVTPSESLEEALGKLAPRDLRLIPVLESSDSERVAGVVTRESLLTAYWNAVADQGR